MEGYLYNPGTLEPCNAALSKMSPWYNKDDIEIYTISLCPAVVNPKATQAITQPVGCE